MASESSSPVIDMETVGSDDGEECNVNGENENGEESKVMTKSQLKKLKKKEKWLLVKAQKRKAEKERQKIRKRECRERGEELGPTRKQLSKNKMVNSSCKIKVAIDCDFDEFMAEKDIKMLVKQVQFSYSANRRAQSPMQFYCCGVSNKTKERLESLGDYKGWDIYFHSESFGSVFDKSSVVYLSSESPNMLQDLEEDKVYIIGGLVDHNHHKGLCHKLAEEKGLSHAQLPISDYIDMKTRKVLTINHVFEILLRYTESKDWQKAFYTVLPPRKGAILKSVSDTDKGHKTEDNLKDPTDVDRGNISGAKMTNFAENDKRPSTDDRPVDYHYASADVDGPDELCGSNTSNSLESNKSGNNLPEDHSEQAEGQVKVNNSMSASTDVLSEANDKGELGVIDTSGTVETASGLVSRDCGKEETTKTDKCLTIKEIR